MSARPRPLIRPRPASGYTKGIIYLRRRPWTIGCLGTQGPLLSLGTGTLAPVANSSRRGARSMRKVLRGCLTSALGVGASMFDSADLYSSGLAEEILGQAISGRRDQVIPSTKPVSGAANG